MTKHSLIAGIAMLALILVVACGPRRDATSPVALKDAASSRIFALGRLEGATPEIELRPQAAGPIVQILVREGQSVERNQILMRVDDRQQKHQVALATAELGSAQGQLERLVNGARSEDRAEAEALYRAKLAELEQARLTWRRTQPLRRANAVSQQEADNQQSRVTLLTAEVEAARARLERVQAPARPDEVKIAQARVAAAQSQLDLASFELEKTRLRSPVAGQVLQINPEIGEQVGPTSSEPAIIVAGTGSFHVRAFVEELDAPKVRRGMLAEITADGLPGQLLSGRVVRLSPRMAHKPLRSDDPGERLDTKTREVWIELDDATDVVIGLRVDVLIDPRTRLHGPPGRVTKVF